MILTNFGAVLHFLFHKHDVELTEKNEFT